MSSKYYRIRGGVFNLWEDEDFIEAKDYDAAIHEAYLMACEVYDSYAGLHGIMSEDEYLEEGEAETEEEAWECYREDRESAVEYEAAEITKEEYESQFSEGLL